MNREVFIKQYNEELKQDCPTVYNQREVIRDMNDEYGYTGQLALDLEELNGLSKTIIKLIRAEYNYTDLLIGISGVKFVIDELCQKYNVSELEIKRAITVRLKNYMTSKNGRSEFDE